MILTVIIDALAYGLPAVSTDWCGVPELLPADSLAVCPICDSTDIAARSLDAIAFAAFVSNRREFDKRFERAAMVRTVRETLIQLFGIRQSKQVE
jgi:hypothetical protein